MLGAMPDRSEEERHLAEADRHIADVEARVARQQQVIEHLSAGGHDTTEAELLLANFAAILETAREHRQLILHRLGQARL
jgi:uncharacterized coiled-coil protein SlyX